MKNNQENSNSPNCAVAENSTIQVKVSWDQTGSGDAVELDVSAFCLSSKLLPSEKWAVYYKNLKTPAEEVSLVQSNTPTPHADILVDPVKIPTNIDEIVFVATLFDAEARATTLGQIDNLTVSVGQEISTEEVRGGVFSPARKFTGETGLVLGTLKRASDPIGNWVYVSRLEGSQKTLGDFVVEFGETVNGESSKKVSTVEDVSVPQLLGVRQDLLDPTDPPAESFLAAVKAKGVPEGLDVERCYSYYKISKNSLRKGLSGVLAYGSDFQHIYSACSRGTSDALLTLNFSEIRRGVHKFTSWAIEGRGRLARNGSIDQVYRTGLGLINDLSAQWTILFPPIRDSLSRVDTFCQKSRRGYTGLQEAVVAGEVLLTEDLHEYDAAVVQSFRQRVTSLKTLRAAWEIDCEQTDLLRTSHADLAARFSDIFQIQFPLWRSQLTRAIMSENTSVGVGADFNAILQILEPTFKKSTEIEN